MATPLTTNSLDQLRNLSTHLSPYIHNPSFPLLRPLYLFLRAPNPTTLTLLLTVPSTNHTPPLPLPSALILAFTLLLGPALALYAFFYDAPSPPAIHLLVTLAPPAAAFASLALFVRPWYAVFTTLPFAIFNAIFAAYRTVYLTPVARFLSGRTADVLVESWERAVVVALLGQDVLLLLVRRWQKAGPSLALVTAVVYGCVIAGMVMESVAKQRRQACPPGAVEMAWRALAANVYVRALVLVEAVAVLWYWRASGGGCPSVPRWVRRLLLKGKFFSKGRGYVRCRC
ncbi:hypothetical protein DIS24_g9301 [Lasiodiplodia hormozganensis]|uniref:Uncharacterized protein n=1 Tax=Lasiodiplodia hormozganensis TaxID=869390 RepID=A0AA39XWR3_9PEZI|nr:hypothetical protein DIS24_g9301 [Lasiodiplodia hormozganensis]